MSTCHEERGSSGLASVSPPSRPQSYQRRPEGKGQIGMWTFKQTLDLDGEASATGIWAT
jgi:hypothetical protein